MRKRARAWWKSLDSSYEIHKRKPYQAVNGTGYEVALLAAPSTHPLTTILKVVSGDTPETLEKVAAMYELIVKPGVHRCSSIKAAEACKVADVINELKTYGVDVFVHDPYADPEEALHEYGVRLFTWDDLPRADAIVAAVSHKQLMSMQVEDFAQKLIKGGCFIDVKACFDAKAFEAAGIKVWRL